MMDTNLLIARLKEWSEIVGDYTLRQDLKEASTELQKHKDLNKELVAVIDEIHDKWITASHYWGSPTNEKAEALIKKSQV